MRFPVIPLFILALPFLEIAGFVIVGQQIGLLSTLALVVASGVLGVLLLRMQGFGLLSRVRAEVDAGRDPGRQLVNGVMMLAAGVLLLIPGFVTDLIGMLLLLPPVRGLVWRLLKDRLVVSAAGFGSFARPGAASRGKRGKTIDLDADEYSNDRRPDSPWRRIDGD